VEAVDLETVAAVEVVEVEVVPHRPSSLP